MAFDGSDRHQGALETDQGSVPALAAGAKAAESAANNGMLEPSQVSEYDDAGMEETTTDLAASPSNGGWEVLDSEDNGELQPEVDLLLCNISIVNFTLIIVSLIRLFLCVNRCAEYPEDHRNTVFAQNLTGLAPQDQACQLY